MSFAPCHQTRQSFALPPATKPVSHLPCPLPPNQSVICLAPYHRVTVSPHHRVTALVSHLPCPLPPSQSVICLAPCHQTSQSFALPPTTTSPCHHVTASPHHHVTALVSHLPCPLPPNQSVICLAPCHQASQSFALPPATKPVSHLPCPLPPSQSVICLAPCHQTSQSFALPPATKPVSHLPCPLPPNQSVICLAPYHRVTTSLRHRATALVSHLPCSLPPSQSVICLAPCHQASQPFALPPATKPVSHNEPAINSRYILIYSKQIRLRLAIISAKKFDFFLLPKIILLQIFLPPVTVVAER